MKKMLQLISLLIITYLAVLVLRLTNTESAVPSYLYLSITGAVLTLSAMLILLRNQWKK
jgi:hypothetical protein